MDGRPVEFEEEWKGKNKNAHSQSILEPVVPAKRKRQEVKKVTKKKN